MMDKKWRLMFVMTVIVVGVWTVIFISKDAINQLWVIEDRRNWIDRCVIEQWESTGEHRVGVRDYCLAEYRQTR
jgi:hypothetical protein